MFVSLQFKLELKKEDKEKLIKLMRKQSSAIRVAYRRLLINLVQSLQGESSGCGGANGRDSAWQVLKVVLLFPILGKVLPILVEGVWDRVRSRLVPLEVGGASR
jgi:predicted transposase